LERIFGLLTNKEEKMRFIAITFMALILASPKAFAGEFVITYTDGQKAAFEAYVTEQTMQEWAQHAFDDKCRRRTEAAISEKTNYNPSKLSEAEKNTIINALKLKKGELRSNVKINP